MRTPRPIMLCAACAALAPAGLTGQSGGVRLEVGASRSFPPAGSRVAASDYLNGALELDYFGADAGLFLGAYGGLDTGETGGNWISGLAGGQVLVGNGPVGFALTGWGYAFRVEAPFPYESVSAQARPELRFRVGSTVLALQGQGGIGTSDVELRCGDRVRTFSFDLWHYGGGPELRIPLGTSASELEFSYAAIRADGGDYRRGEARLVGRFDSGTVITGNLALWDTPLGRETAGGVTVRVAVGRFFAEANGSRSEPDPLLNSETGGQGGVMIGSRLADFGPKPPTPLVSLSPTASGARATFRLDLRAAASSVELLGDFTGWEPVALTNDDGIWSVELDVPCGTHHYGFQVDGRWYVPETAPGRISDDWGQVNATLVVLGPADQVDAP